MSSDKTSQSILITGASQGIGLAVALECANSGYAIHIAARHENNLESAREKLLQKGAKQVIPHVLDVSDRNAVFALAKKISTLDALINVAGVVGAIGELQDLDLDEFEETLKINFLGTVYTCQAFLPHLRLSKGKILNFSGGGATGPFPRFSAYAASKAAVVRFTENLSVELEATGITVNAIAPGFVVTRLQEDIIQAGERAGKQLAYSQEQVAKKGGVPPEMAARLCVKLLGEDQITGKLISAPWDPWQESSYLDRLRQDKNLATLRRIDDIHFIEKKNSERGSK